jgi:hypothetical protein
MNTPVSEAIQQDPGSEAVDGDALKSKPAEEWEAVDDMFDILSNHRRRRVIQYTETNDDAVVGDLAEHIAAIENKKPISSLSSQERKRVYIALYQSHLPKMAAANVIDYDKNRGTVVLLEDAKDLCQLLSEPDPPRRWSKYYLTYTAVSLLMLGVGAFVFSTGITAVMGFLLMGYVLLTVGHAVFEYTNIGDTEPFDGGGLQ